MNRPTRSRAEVKRFFDFVLVQQLKHFGSQGLAIGRNQAQTTKAFNDDARTKDGHEENGPHKHAAIEHVAEGSGVPKVGCSRFSQKHLHIVFRFRCSERAVFSIR